MSTYPARTAKEAATSAPSTTRNTSAMSPSSIWPGTLGTERPRRVRSDASARIRENWAGDSWFPRRRPAATGATWAYRRAGAGDLEGSPQDPPVRFRETSGTVTRGALVEVNFPGMSGLEFARRAAAHHPDVRLLIVSAYDDYA